MTLKEYLAEEKNRVNFFSTLRGKIVAAVAIILAAVGVAKGPTNAYAEGLVDKNAQNPYALVTNTTNNVSEFLQSKGFNVSKSEIKEKIQDAADAVVEKVKSLATKQNRLIKKVRKWTRF